MTTTQNHEFETHRPTSLYVELGRGSLTVNATETTATTVEVHGTNPEEVRVEQHGERISVVAPRQRVGFLSSEAGFDVVVTLPSGSDLAAKTGSAEITAHGTIGSCEIKTGSGEVRVDTLTAPSHVESGSGDLVVGTARAALRVKSGSGDVIVRDAEDVIAASTGSGDVEIGTSHAPAAVKTGSGDFHVVDAYSDVSMATGSGDLVIGTARRGKLTLKGASSDVRIGIPAGTPVWTDISTISGSIRSDLDGAGQPADGADHIELRAKTVSGDITLSQI